MDENIMIVKMNKSILNYYYMIADLDNESQRVVIMEEFIEELTKAINVNGKKKKIKWVDTDE